MTVPGHPTFTNRAALAQIDRSQPLTVTWTGGAPGQFVMIGGFSSNHNTGLPPQIAAGNRDFICSEGADKGTFAVPTYITQSLWPTPDASGALLINYAPTSQPLNIPGLDGAYWFIDGNSDEGEAHRIQVVRLVELIPEPPHECFQQHSCALEW